MNVLLLTYSLSAEIGGSEYVFSILAELLAKKGHKVWIITNHIDGFTYPTNENIKIIFVSFLPANAVKHPKNKDKALFNLLAIKSGFSIIRQQKIDIIHSNQTIPALSGAILSTLTSKPHITTIHDVVNTRQYLEEWSKQKGNTKSKAMLSYFITKIIYKLKHEAIHTVSDSVKEDIKKFGIKKPIYVINNAIPIYTLEHVTTNPLQLIYVGRLVFHKNIQVIIKALKLVKKSCPNVSLVIVGQGNSKKDLERLVSELDLNQNVKFKGLVSENEKNKLVAQSAALLLPSLHEGFGIVILEAFAQKKPVLVSNIRPMSDVVEQNKTGLLISAKDEKEWSKAIEYILEDPKRMSEMGESGKKVLQEKYNLDNWFTKILEMYNDLIKNKGKAK